MNISVIGTGCSGLVTGACFAEFGIHVTCVDKDEHRIGLLKALGSDEGTLLGEYLQMAAVLGVVAGLLGACGGWAAVSYLNRWGPAGSPELIFTPRLGAAIFFIIAMTAMVAAVAPAIDAVRQDTTWLLYSSSPGNAVQGGWVS
jgi:predicted lysophospholipase L1 biosynthesis ABC-type transport system permease subunit